MNTLKLDISELEIDENENEIAGADNSRYFDFNESFKTNIVLIPNSEYRTLSFAEVTSPFVLIVTSDKLLNVEVNGDEIINTKIVVLNTQINSVKVANVDLESANVNVYIWGKQS